MKVKVTKAQINYLIALINQKLDESPQEDASILQNLRAKLLEFGESNNTGEEDPDIAQHLRHILSNIHGANVDTE